MGKKKRLQDLRSTRHIKVDDAASLIGDLISFRQWASDPRASAEHRRVAGLTDNMLGQWLNSPVVLRVDNDFAGALLGSDTDVELVPDWLARMPFNAIAYSFPQRISLHDGKRLCHYTGFLATGTRTTHLGTYRQIGTRQVEDVWTSYGPFSEADGVRCLWAFTDAGSPLPNVQTVTLQLRGKDANHRTLSEAIAGQTALATDIGQSLGQELDTLIPLSLMLLLYSASGEPDLDWLPQAEVVRPHQIRDAKIGELGWRVGGALRTWRRNEPTAGRDDATPAGWRLPPHIRRAHWHRVRIATRNATGAVIGSTTGVQGQDWAYEVRWYPPTPVNASDGISPVVRELAGPDPAR